MKATPTRYTVQAEDGGYELHGGGDPGWSPRFTRK